MKAYLNENKNSIFGNRFEFHLTENKIADPNFSWEEEGEEFRYKQELYDVVSIENKGGDLIIRCLKDNDENTLEKQVNEIHSLDKNNSSKPTHNSVKTFSVFYLQQNNIIELLENHKLILLPLFSSELITQIVETLQPPPDVNKIC
jgi:hypothetical protein